MPAQREEFGPKDVRLDGLSSAIFDSLYRRLDGTWMFRLRVDGEAVLPDGRRVRIDRHIGIAATECVPPRQAIA